MSCADRVLFPTSSSSRFRICAHGCGNVLGQICSIAARAFIREYIYKTGYLRGTIRWRESVCFVPRPIAALFVLYWLLLLHSTGFFIELSELQFHYNIPELLSLRLFFTSNVMGAVIFMENFIAFQALFIAGLFIGIKFEIFLNFNVKL